jgi:hypothetical protein
MQVPKVWASVEDRVLQVNAPDRFSSNDDMRPEMGIISDTGRQQRVKPLLSRSGGNRLRCLRRVSGVRSIARCDPKGESV